jgi:hypothetical protein
MGADPNQPHVNTQFSVIVKALREQYPKLVEALTSQTKPIAESNVKTQESIAPREQALSSSLYNKYSPEYAKTGAENDLNSITGAGGKSVVAANDVNKAINPEYYAARAGSADKLGQLLSGIDPNRLTGAESENVARGLARTGYKSGELNTPSNQGAINAAQTYGSALNEKRNTVSNAINTATQALPSFNMGNDVFNQGTGGARSAVQGFTSGPGYAGTSPQASADLGKSALDVSSGLQAQRMGLKAQQRDYADRSAQFVGSTICCFIFMEAYGNKLPDYVRVCRDYWYNKYPELSIGYKKMAKWLVPLMKRFKIVRYLVNVSMIKPISRVGKWLVKDTEVVSKSDIIIHGLWFKFWRTYAKS